MSHNTRRSVERHKPFHALSYYNKTMYNKYNIGNPWNWCEITGSVDDFYEKWGGLPLKQGKGSVCRVERSEVSGKRQAVISLSLFCFQSYKFMRSCSTWDFHYNNYEISAEFLFSQSSDYIEVVLSTHCFLSSTHLLISIIYLIN